MTTNEKPQWEKEFERLTDGLIKHAGKWHDENCDFPRRDRAVCYCDFSSNEEKIKSFIRTLLTQARQEERDRLAEKIRWLIKGVANPRGTTSPHELNAEYDQAIADVFFLLNSKE